MDFDNKFFVCKALVGSGEISTLELMRKNPELLKTPGYHIARILRSLCSEGLAKMHESEEKMYYIATEKCKEYVLTEEKARTEKLEAEKKIREKLIKSKKRKKAIIITTILFIIFAIISFFVVAGISYIKEENRPYKEIEAALDNGTFTSEWVVSKGYEYEIDSKKGVEKIAAKLHELHSEDNVKEAIKILLVLFEFDVEIDGEYYYASDSFIDWLKSEAKENGKGEYWSYNNIYELYGHTLSWSTNSFMNSVYLDSHIITTNNSHYSHPISEKVEIQ